MCGIAGIFDHRGQTEIDHALLHRMTDIVGHPVPAAMGFILRRGLARLSATRDHRSCGHLSGTFDLSAPIWQLLMFDAFLRNSQEPPGSGPFSPQDELRATP